MKPYQLIPVINPILQTAASLHVLGKLGLNLKVRGRHPASAGPSQR